MMADSEVLMELRQLRAQVRDLTEARSGHDDVVRDLGDAMASLKKENDELRELLRKRGVPSSPVPLPRRREGAWTQVKNKETSRGRPQTPPPATRNSFATLADECAEVGIGKTVEPSLSSVIFAESLEVLVMALEALHEEAKPLGLEVSWLKTKVQVFGDLLDEAVQSVHACGEDIEILESFTYLGSTQSIMTAGHVKKPYGGLA
ncbi:hypothetical protein GWK47_027046 [Chionoecetes opilio]|uniref:Uncharacterized protein n=1 Tax=Chionoecetes opilio TaxID=41210 RepID=A0A8J8WDZ2_CHIOP|nr:hypothetical protein GWK47_027046 [Chionoecetes opilio]